MFELDVAGSRGGGGGQFQILDGTLRFRRPVAYSWRADCTVVAAHLRRFDEALNGTMLLK